MKTFLILVAIVLLLYGIAGILLKAAKKKLYERQREYDATKPEKFDYSSAELKWNENRPRPDDLIQFPGSPILTIFLPLAFIICMMFLTIIPAQTCGIVVTPGGVKQHSYSTGWHMVLPWYKVRLMDKTAQVYTCARRTSVDPNSKEYKEYKESATQSTTIWTPTKDGIKMGFDISASWAIDPEYAWWIYDNVSEQDGGSNGRFYWLEENVIKAKLKSALALCTSKYTPIEIYSNKREVIQEEAVEKMRRDIKTYHLVLTQIDIREIYYDPEYEKSINAKKLEEQKALTLVEVTKQKQELEIQAAIDKNIEILRAQGEAEALRIKGNSIAASPKVVQLEWIQKWDGKLPVTMLGNGQGIMLNMSDSK